MYVKEMTISPDLAELLGRVGAVDLVEVLEDLLRGTEEREIFVPRLPAF